MVFYVNVKSLCWSSSHSAKLGMLSPKTNVSHQILLSGCLFLSRTHCFFPFKPPKQLLTFHSHICTSCSSEGNSHRERMRHAAAAEMSRPFFLCLLMSVCLEVGRSHADRSCHMVHPSEPLEIHELWKALSCHLRPASQRVMGWERQG